MLLELLRLLNSLIWELKVSYNPSTDRGKLVESKGKVKALFAQTEPCLVKVVDCWGVGNQKIETAQCSSSFFVGFWLRSNLWGVSRKGWIAALSVSGIDLVSPSLESIVQPLKARVCCATLHLTSFFGERLVRFDFSEVRNFVSCFLCCPFSRVQASFRPIGSSN